MYTSHSQKPVYEFVICMEKNSTFQSKQQLKQNTYEDATRVGNNPQQPNNMKDDNLTSAVEL